MLPLSRDPPVFWIFAGPNGSGKSTAYSAGRLEDEMSRIWIVNPDLLTATIREAEGLDLQPANLAAVTRMEAWLDATLELHRSVGVETVLSTEKYRRLVDKAQTLGFLVRLTYVLLDTPERNIERVKLRVLKGGHDVPEDKIVARYWRSLEQMPWFLERAELAEIFDNSAAEPRLVARKSAGRVIVAPDAPENLRKALAL